MHGILLDSVLSPDDTVGDLKKLIAAQTGTKWDRIVLKKWFVNMFFCICFVFIGILLEWSKFGKNLC